MSNLLLNFPDGFTPNKNQVEILKSTERAIDDGYKFIIINAPTGSGKSFFPKTCANWVNGPTDRFKSLVDDYSIYSEDGPELVENEERFGVFALTITKSLQDQYKDTFEDTGILKGQNNYQCQVDESLTVDTAPCLYVKGLKRDCWSCNKCPYYNDRNEMLKSPFSALSYSMFFSLPEHVKGRKIIVCDEASELEEQLVSQFTCIIDIPFLVKIGVDLPATPVQETIPKMYDWLSRVMAASNKKIEYYISFFKESGKKDAEFHKKKTEYSKLSNFIRSLELLIATFYDSQYIVERVDKNIKFIPLKVDKLAQYLFKHGDHIVLMSATIIDPVNFCKVLGIEKYKYIEVSSDFDSSKAPIYVMAKQKINYANLKNMLPTLCQQIKGILETHKGEKGIIHTHTQYITDYVRDNISSNRLLCRDIGMNNEELMDIHCNSSGDTVLVSPSMTYGVDLKGDLAKFQIVLKAPWLPTKDVRVEKMMKLDSSWYSNKMLCTLVQGCGRGVRTTTDECITYILDGSIYDTISKNKKKLPSFFLDRLQ